MRRPSGDGIQTQIVNLSGTSTTTINVTGTISAGGASRHGISAQVITGGTNTITVSGSVAANLGTGILSSGTGDHLTVASGGSVSGVTGIQFTSSGTGATLVNSGMVTGTGANAIVFASTADTFTNSGTVNGNVLLGGGGDLANLNTGSMLSGTLKRSIGHRHGQVAGTGSGTFDISKLQSIELGEKIDSGTWTLTGAGRFPPAPRSAAGCSA